MSGTSAVPAAAGVDPRHVWLVCTAAAHAVAAGTIADVMPGRDGPARVYLPDRDTARAAEEALAAAGYEARRPAGPGSGRDLVVHGWSARLLDARLAALAEARAVLRSAPAATAMHVLRQVGHLAPSALPDAAGQQWLVGQAGQQQRDWARRTCGPAAPADDPAARPGHPALALRLSAVRDAEKAVSAMTDLHLRIASLALARYPVLMSGRGPEPARATAVRQAAGTIGVRLPPPRSGTGPAPGQTPPWAAARQGRESPGAREFPGTGPPVLPPGPQAGAGPEAARRPGPPPGRRDLLP